MKKIILFLSILLLSGCYDYVEINNLVIISAMLIDYQNNEYSITSQVIQNDKETEVRVFTTNGKSIDECISKISNILNKDIFISHMKVLLLTENVIKNNVDYYNYFLRNAKSKMNYYVYYVDNNYKDKILSIYKDKTASALYIKDLMKYNHEIFSSSTPVSFLDLMYKKLNYGIEPIYPNIIISKNSDEDVLYLQGLVAFNSKKEKILLNNKQTIIYNMLSNNLGKTTLNIPCDDKSFSLTINNSKTKYSWNKIFIFNLSIDSKLGSYSCGYDLNEPDTISKLSKLSENYIKDNINDVVNISVNNKIDFLGIGNYIYKHDKNYFDFEKQDWNNNLSKLNIKNNVNVKITSIGEMRK